MDTSLFNLVQCCFIEVNTTLDYALCFQLYYPNPWGLRDVLQALDTDSRLDLLPTIWKGECKDNVTVYRSHSVDVLSG